MKKNAFLIALAVLLVLCTMLFACDNRTEVTVTVNYNNGTEAGTITVESGVVCKLPTPEKKGYAFAGWYDNENFSGENFTEITPNENVTVYAKWEKLYTLTLDPAGGTLSTTKLSLRAGENIASRLADLIPEKTDCRFGTWLIGDAELSADAVMGASDLTLTAKYKAKYTVEIFLQNKALNGYEKRTELITDYAYTGERFTSTQTVKGFTEVANDNTVKTLVISDVAADNVFRHYFDRATYTLTFVSNFPDGSEIQTKTVELRYGVETDLPFRTFEAEGFYLEGWSTTANGEIEYFSHVMDSRLYNVTAHAVEKITLEGNMTLYAVWSKGYTDLFGGKDIIYVSKAEEETVYLFRGDTFFKGEIDSNRKIYFYDKNDDILFDGQLNSDDITFLYTNQARSEISSTLYVTGKGLIDTTKIYFDAANGIRYTTDNGSGGTDTSLGEYYFDEDGYIIATFSTGALAGKTLTIIVGSVTLENVSHSAFQVKNEEEAGLGQIFFFIVDGNALTVALDDVGNPVGDVRLNGFGLASYNKGSQTISYYYTYDPATKTITMLNSSGKVAGVLRLMTVNGVLGYMLYDEKTDVSYTLADGSVLKLDGMQTASYTKDGVTVSGFFTTETSAFGGTILSFTAGDVVYRFLITTTTVTVPVDPSDPDAGTKTETTTKVEEKSSVYEEYYYQDEKGTYYAPLFVIDADGHVTVYGYSKTKTYHRIAEGTFVYVPETGAYLFTVTNRFTPEEEVFTSPIDFSTVDSCVVMLDSETTSYHISFWLRHKSGETETDHTTVYTEKKDGAATLTLVAGLAVYRVGGVVEVGTIKQSGSLYIVSTKNHTLYVELDEGSKTFTVYTYNSVTANEVDKEGMIRKDRYLVIDPKSGVKFFIVTTEGEGSAAVSTTTEIPGKLYDTGRTSLTKFKVYRFVSDELLPDSETPAFAFEFIMTGSDSTSYIFTYDASYAGTYLSSNGRLALDGFGFAGKYADDSGLDITGFYTKKENEVQITDSGNTYRFVLNETLKTCVRRTEEYGKTYLLRDNQTFDGKYITMDGIGGFKIFTLDTSGETAVPKYIDENGTYTKVGNIYIFVYHDDAAEVTLRCKAGTFTYGSNAYYTMNITHEEVVRSYVNEIDWSILVLDDDGTAKKYGKDGVLETGSYSLITDSMLYYCNDAGTDAAIYFYDNEKGTATPKTYSVKAYYTTDLDSLLFSKYGFAIFNNSTRYYYTVNADGIVTIYHLDTESPEASKYGYVAETFGTFDEIKEYNGKTYYANDGYAITFNRKEATKNKFPLLMTTTPEELYAPIENLIFTPTGDVEFAVNGTVTLNGKTYRCTVIRALEGEEAKMYVVLGTYRFDITISYQGDVSGTGAANTYEVTALKNIQSFYSNNYLYMVYLISSMFGQKYASQIKNDHGYMRMIVEFDEDGKQTRAYLNGAFGKSSGMIDADGNLIASISEAPVGALGNKLFVATFTGADGYTYEFYYTYGTFQAFNVEAYMVYALVRLETLTTSDGYEVTVGRVIVSDNKNMTPGTFFSLSIKKGETELKTTNLFAVNDKLYAVVRETDEEGRITKTTYYEIILAEKDAGEVSEGEEESKVLLAYKSVTVTELTARTYYSADGKTYVDVLDGNRVLLFSIDGTFHVVTASTYDAETGVITATTATGDVYTITIGTDGTATVTLVPAQETTEETA